MTAQPFDPGSEARRRRPDNVRATGSAAPPDYSPLQSAPDPVYTHLSHAAQYGRGRRYGIGIRCLILHTTESENFRNSLAYNTWRPETVSSSAHAGPDGELAYEIEDHNRPWTTGRWNDESLTLEIVGRAAWTAAQWRARPRQMEAIVRWIVENCRRHRIPAELLTAEEFAEGASRAGQSPLRPGTRRGVVDHRIANDAAISLGHSPSKYSHWDIGPGLRQVVADDLMPEVRRRLGVAPPVVPAPPVTYARGGSMFFPAEPHARLVDTRTGRGRPAPGKVAPGQELRVTIPPPAGKTAAELVAAVLNITIVDPDQLGHVQVGGKLFGDASSGNFGPGMLQDADGNPLPQPADPSSCVAAVADGYCTVRVARATAHVIVDLQGVVTT